VLFNSEIYDTDTIHATGSSTERLTCKTAGKYAVSLQIVISAVGDHTYDAVWIQHDSRGRIAQQGLHYKGSTTLSTIIDLAVNDYLVVVMYKETTGVNVIYSAGNEYSPFFEMQKIAA